MWFFQNRRGEWEVWAITNAEEVFVGAWDSYAVACREADKYAQENGILTSKEVV